MIQPINPFESLTSAQLDFIDAAVRKQAEHQMQLFGMTSEYLKAVLDQLSQLKRDE